MGKEGLDTLKENKTKQLLSEAYSNKNGKILYKICTKQENPKNTQKNANFQD